MSQRFYASPNDAHVFSNNAVGYSPGGPFDCLGPYSKVVNCPIAGTDLRKTCYATAYADTHFSIPACTSHRHQHIRGYFSVDSEGAIEFRPMDKYKDRLL